MQLNSLVNSVEQYSVYVILVGCCVSLVLLIMVLSLSSKNKKLGQRLGRLESANLALESIEKLDLQNLDLQLTGIEKKYASALSHVAMVRFNAFENSGNGLSFALAVLNDNRDGFVISSLFGGNETRTYAKQIIGGNPSHALSPEEEEAIKIAMGR